MKDKKTSAFGPVCADPDCPALAMRALPEVWGCPPTPASKWCLYHSRMQAKFLAITAELEP